ncbi:unnamed protein product [Camellia sinensis]
MRMEDKVRMRNTKKSWEDMKMMMMREIKKSREQKMLKTEMNFLRSLDLGLFIVFIVEHVNGFCGCPNLFMNTFFLLSGV